MTHCRPDCHLCAARDTDRLRYQAENWDRVRVATDAEKDEVLRWLNDHQPDVLREAMDGAAS